MVIKFFSIDRFRLHHAFIMVMSMLFLSVANIAAAVEVTKQVHFEWDYDTGLPGLTGYVIYHNGQPVVTIDNPAALTVDLDILLDTGETHIFTMKALFDNSTESGLSSPYRLNLPADAIELQPPPNLRILIK